MQLNRRSRLVSWLGHRLWTCKHPHLTRLKIYSKSYYNSSLENVSHSWYGNIFSIQSGEFTAVALCHQTIWRWWKQYGMLGRSIKPLQLQSPPKLILPMLTVLSRWFWVKLFDSICPKRFWYYPGYRAVYCLGVLYHLELRLVQVLGFPGEATSPTSPRKAPC